MQKINKLNANNEEIKQQISKNVESLTQTQEALKCEIANKASLNSI